MKNCAVAFFVCYQKTLSGLFIDIEKIFGKELDIGSEWVYYIIAWLQSGCKEQKKSAKKRSITRLFPLELLKILSKNQPSFFSKNQAIIKKKHIKNPLVERKTPQLFHVQI
ncbi:MAG: hypothetical protein LUH43_02980 [Clostridia bacterium]|nr:hypothetical protein [Clostridia bacterium]